jgi:hypothetical protein
MGIIPLEDDFLTSTRSDPRKFRYRRPGKNGAKANDLGVFFQLATKLTSEGISEPDTKVPLARPQLCVRGALVY